MEISLKTVIGLIIGVIILFILIKATISLIAFIIPKPQFDKDTVGNFDRLISEINGLEDESTIVYYIKGSIVEEPCLVSFSKKGVQEIERPPNIECSEKACLCICQGSEKKSCSNPYKLRVCEPLEGLDVIKAPNGGQIKLNGGTKSKIYNLHLKLEKDAALGNVLIIASSEEELTETKPGGATGSF